MYWPMLFLHDIMLVFSLPTMSLELTNFPHFYLCWNESHCLIFTARAFIFSHKPPNIVSFVYVSTFDNPNIDTIFFVLQLYESLNFRHMSKYIIVWPWMTLDFIHRHWTWFYDIGDILSFNLSGHMMTCVVSSWFYITLHFAPCLSLDVLIFHIWPVLEWTSLAYFYSWSIHIFPKTA